MTALDGFLPSGDGSEQVRTLYPEVDWAALLSRPATTPEFLLEPVLEAGRGHSLAGAAKSGKSLIAQEMTASVASGRAAFGNPGREPVHVVYLDNENTEEDLAERMRAFGYAPADLTRLHYLSFAGLPYLDTEAGGAALAAIAEAYSARLVVLDTISRYVRGEENSSDTWHAVYRCSLAPLKAARVAVLRLDHSGRDESKGARGSSAKDGDVDHVWTLAATGERLTLTRTRSRNGHGAGRVDLVRRYGPLRHERRHVGTQADDRRSLVMVALDFAGLPLDAGRERAREALAKAHISIGNDELRAILRDRQNAAGDLTADLTNDLERLGGVDLTGDLTNDHGGVR